VDAGSPPRFEDQAIIYFRARRLFAFQLLTRDRKRLYALVSQALAQHLATVDLGLGWMLDLDEISRDMRDRIARFEEWKGRLVIREEVLGGEPVFPASRLAVRHIGLMLLRGAERIEVREDYPYLTDEDVEFAPLYATAYPRLGRPRAQAAAG
jgi:uncharacterized protein (DUF433 family)